MKLNKKIRVFLANVVAFILPKRIINTGWRMRLLMWIYGDSKKFRDLVINKIYKK